MMNDTSHVTLPHPSVAGIFLQKLSELIEKDVARRFALKHTHIQLQQLEMLFISQSNISVVVLDDRRVEKSLSIYFYISS